MATITKTYNFPVGVTGLRAGTPVDTNCIPANNGNAVGIVKENVVAPNKTVTVLTSGTWNIDFGYSNCGIMLSVECMRKLYNITFKNSKGETVQLPFSGSYNDLKNKPTIPTRATEEVAGTVLMAANVAQAAGEAPTAEEFNGLVNALIDSGAIAEEATEEE